MSDLRFREWTGGQMVYSDDCYTLSDFFKLADEEAVEQYTGLKDKNGKEIYEGDILRFADNMNFGETGRHCLAVSWDNKNGAWYPMVDIIRDYNCKGDVITNLWMNENPYVIGNIHENPELLNA